MKIRQRYQRNHYYYYSLFFFEIEADLTFCFGGSCIIWLSEIPDLDIGIPKSISKSFWAPILEFEFEFEFVVFDLGKFCNILGENPDLDIGIPKFLSKLFWAPILEFEFERVKKY